MLLSRLSNRLWADLVLCSTVTIRSTTDAEAFDKLNALADAVLEDIAGTPAPLAADAQTVASTKWVCSVCGYVYEGETIPEDYKCPICGVGPDKFVKE